MIKTAVALVGLTFLVGACGPTDASGDGGGDGDAGPVICTAGTAEPCYDGPVGTKDNGICTGGMRTCASGGRHWGACEGQVLPAATDICSNGLDDDCDGQTDVDADLDGDGFTRCGGDCCETTAECGDPASVNPAAEEAPTAMDAIAVDDNCDGQIDETPLPCDADFSVDDGDAAHAAFALGLCKVADPMGIDSGLLSAAYVRANGAPAAASQQYGIFDQFGPNLLPREGNRVVSLSSGHARRPGEVGSCDEYSCYGYGDGVAPTGFPQDVANCTGSTEINDDVALEVSLRAPSNATGYSVDFSFYTFEYPEWVCTDWNDQFIVLVSPPPPGSVNGNIAFDTMMNPVSVNIAFFNVCSGCSAGTGELEGTGFDMWDDAGATGWLRSTAPINPGEEFTIRFAIWDTGDQAWDSTVILDNFQWIVTGSPGVGTTPID